MDPKSFEKGLKESMEPQKFGRYEVRKKLGQGQMGVVYKAWDPISKRELAIKVCKMDVPIDSPMEKRMVEEACAMAQLSHNHIVTLYDVNREGDYLFLAMEYVDGMALNTLMAQGYTLTPQEIAAMGAQIAAALDYAHRSGVVHRDIKPANVLIAKNNYPKIVDFGIATISHIEQTLAKGIQGTLAYMSPEQATCKPVDGRSDLFSLGVILYELITRKKPFTGLTRSEVSSQIVSHKPTPPRNFAGNIPRELQKIVLKALEKDPKKRFQNGREMAQALESFAEQSSSSRPHKLLLAVGVPSVLVLLACAAALYVTRTNPPFFLQNNNSTIPNPPNKNTQSDAHGYIHAITNPPGASFWLNGNMKGTTPLVVELEPGNHRIKYVLKGYNVEEIQIQLEPNQTVTVASQLTRKMTRR